MTEGKGTAIGYENRAVSLCLRGFQYSCPHQFLLFNFFYFFSFFLFLFFNFFSLTPSLFYSFY